VWIFLRGLCRWPYLNFKTVCPPAFFLNSFVANVELVSEAGNYKFCLSLLIARDYVSTKALWYSKSNTFFLISIPHSLVSIFYHFPSSYHSLLPSFLPSFLPTFLPSSYRSLHHSFLPTSDSFILKQNTKLNLNHSGSTVLEIWRLQFSTMPLWKRRNIHTQSNTNPLLLYT